MYGPKNTRREAAKLGFITDAEAWFTFLDARNMATHLYKEERAMEVYTVARGFYKQVESFLKLA